MDFHRPSVLASGEWIRLNAVFQLPSDLSVCLLLSSGLVSDFKQHQNEPLRRQQDERLATLVCGSQTRHSLPLPRQSNRLAQSVVSVVLSLIRSERLPHAARRSRAEFSLLLLLLARVNLLALACCAGQARPSQGEEPPGHMLKVSDMNLAGRRVQDAAFAGAGAKAAREVKHQQPVSACRLNATTTTTTKS